jgi:hypothetical protein
MSTFSKKCQNGSNNISGLDEVQWAVELTRSFVHDLLGQLSVIVGHCDLVSGALKPGRQSSMRMVEIQEILRGMARELNEYQIQIVEIRPKRGNAERDVA